MRRMAKNTNVHSMCAGLTVRHGGLPARTGGEKKVLVTNEASGSKGKPTPSALHILCDLDILFVRSTTRRYGRNGREGWDLGSWEAEEAEIGTYCHVDEKSLQPCRAGNVSASYPPRLRNQISKVFLNRRINWKLFSDRRAGKCVARCQLSESVSSHRRSR